MVFDGTFAGPGRPKGSKTKRVLNTNSLIELLNSNNYDPVIDQINLARDPACPHGTRQKINSDLMKLLYPAVRAVEHSGSVETRALNISWNVGDTVPAEPSVEALEADNSVPLTVDPLDKEKALQDAPEGLNGDDGIEY